MPESVLSILNSLSHLILKNDSKYFYNPPFRNEETEGQRN